MGRHSQPRPPIEMQILEKLDNRMHLAREDHLNYQNLRKGYIGEKRFAHLLQEKLSCSPIILYDILLKLNNSEFQIDSLILFYKTIYLLEIKNFYGDYYYEEDNWYIKDTKKEIASPLKQVKRSDLLFKELLQKRGYQIQVLSYAVFVNPEFTLYQAPINAPLILPTQLNRLIKRLNEQPTNINKHHTKLAGELTDLHIQDNSYRTRIPNYTYGHLKKGITCHQCSAFLTKMVNQDFECTTCGYKERVRSSILRCIIEFNLLFPEQKITTTRIYDWCDGVASKKVIRHTLQEYFFPVENGRARHYIFKNNRR